MQPLTFITLSPDRESFRELSDALAADERTRLVADCDDAEHLMSSLSRLRPAAAVVVLNNGNSAKAIELVKNIASAHPETAVITAGRDTPSSVMLNSLRSGARDFIQLPVNAEEFSTVVSRTAEFCAAHTVRQRKSGPAVAVFSTKGGTGVSFIATNLAASLPAPTLLVDLNLQAGDADSFLGVEAKFTVADAVRNRARLDDSLLASFVTQCSSRLSLLAAPLEAHEAEDVHAEDVTEVVHLVRERYDFVVFDLPHSFDPVTVAALDQASDILLVLTLDIPGIRSAKRALKIFDRIGYPRKKIHVVVNRHSKQIDVELQKVELHLGERLIGFVPNDYKKVMDSINLGQPLVQSDPSSRISAEIRRIAAHISGGGQSVPAQPRKGFLKSIFNRQETPTTTFEFHTSPDEA
jgi:pilus assembly protein CpaE